MAHQYEIRAFRADGTLIDTTVCNDMAGLVSGAQLLTLRVSQAPSHMDREIESVEFWRMDTDPPRNLTKDELDEITPAMEKFGWLEWERNS